VTGVETMEIRQRRFVLVMLGAIGFAVVGFLVRGLSQLFVTTDTAYVLAAPLFVVAGGLAVLSFLLSVLVKTGLLSLGTS
jgi:hypothetical protein